jgi:N-formylglutamate amidohydrolase
VEFGFSVLIDCHSMPSVIRGMDLNGRPDVILGDRYGTSCSSELTEAAAAILKRRGLKVARNKPYAGGFITEHYGRPAKGLHALQVEINRGLYMNEETLEKSEGFEALASELCLFVEEIVASAGAAFLPRSLAAE